MIKTNDTTYNIAKSVKCLVIKSHLSLFLKEDRVAFNEKNQMDTLTLHHTIPTFNDPEKVAF